MPTPQAELVFVGTGEALDPDLPNTSLLVRGPQTLLLDCGYAVPHALWKITRDVDLLDAVWIATSTPTTCSGSRPCCCGCAWAGAPGR